MAELLHVIALRTRAKQYGENQNKRECRCQCSEQQKANGILFFHSDPVKRTMNASSTRQFRATYVVDGKTTCNFIDVRQLFTDSDQKPGVSSTGPECASTRS